MAEYHRFVSYVYAYENNLKTRNSGFARVETRDRQCFIYLHMKEMYGGSHTIYRVYLFKRAEERHHGDLFRKYKAVSKSG